jgi:succinylarginine dihydrolase
MMTTEISFEGIPGPSHSFGGLAYGDFASMASAGKKSSPRTAAKQCIHKIRLLLQNGVRVVILPPHERPALWFLRGLGYRGTDSEVLQSATHSASWLLPIIYSSSGMWCANSATVIPSTDTTDGRCHLIVANLAANSHRSLEPPYVLKILRRILPESAGFEVQPSIPGDVNLWDEGAANHVRLSRDDTGLHIFAHGRKAGQSFAKLLQDRDHILARQTDEASLAVARLAKLPPERLVLAQQSQSVIDRGVFHNDVIFMSAGTTLILHELAFQDWPRLKQDIRCSATSLNLGQLEIIELGNDQISIEEAVRTYFFNSQLTSLPNGRLLMVCPAACQESEEAKTALATLRSALGSKLITAFVDLSESLANGGGPACLRLRVTMTDQQLQVIPRSFITDTGLLDRLEATVDRLYRETLMLEELVDPDFAQECRGALDEVAGLLGYGAIYSFQV